MRERCRGLHVWSLVVRRRHLSFKQTSTISDRCQCWCTGNENVRIKLSSKYTVCVRKVPVHLDLSSMEINTISLPNILKYSYGLGGGGV